QLPPAYPHVLAMPVHMALLSSDAFPVQLFGLVHVSNRIEQLRPVRIDDEGELRTSLEGHRDTDRGQEFDLHTELLGPDGSAIWREVCTLLARRRGRRTGGEGRAATTARPEAPEPEQPSTVRSTSFHAEAGIGRRYGWVSGDVNPIHIADLTARAFGFDRAIAHGMWSLARCAAELGPGAFAGPCTLEVEFKLPVFLPAWVTMQSWDFADGTAFALRDAQGDKPHLSGTLTRMR
ncbi:MAG TPA: MaoC/PaaZ C-terminal domain-containing protein, partial [Steroidobacteraceae bacterium]|nr:MaoC/PaaZ C-terminal domain-containing protein [Steroidobacteraceae bacterium]